MPLGEFWMMRVFISVEIFASSNLDEYAITDLVSQDAPIDGFGVGTRMSVSSDAPTIDCAYKLVSYASRGRMKALRGKVLAPRPQNRCIACRKVARMRGDVIALADERVPEGTPLLIPVMRQGVRLSASRSDLAACA